MSEETPVTVTKGEKVKEAADYCMEPIWDILTEIWGDYKTEPWVLEAFAKEVKTRIRAYFIELYDMDKEDENE